MIAVADAGVRHRLGVLLAHDDRFVVINAVDTTDSPINANALKADVLVVEVGDQDARWVDILDQLTADDLPQTVVLRGPSSPTRSTAPPSGVNFGRRASDRAQRIERDLMLTQREKEILSAVLAACSNKDIAARFGITETTVKHHLSNIFNKVGVSSRLELAMFAQHYGLGRVEPDTEQAKQHVD